MGKIYSTLTWVALVESLGIRNRTKGPESILYSEATCYECDIRYPTDVQLFWEFVSWTYVQLKQKSQDLKRHMPRTKYREWMPGYILYDSKMGRKTKRSEDP